MDSSLKQGGQIALERVARFRTVFQEAIACAQEEGGDMKPIALPFEMDLVQLRIKDKKLMKIMRGKDRSQVGGSLRGCLLDADVLSLSLSLSLWSPEMCVFVVA